MHLESSISEIKSDMFKLQPFTMSKLGFESRYAINIFIRVTLKYGVSKITTCYMLPILESTIEWKNGH